MKGGRDQPGVGIQFDAEFGGHVVLGFPEFGRNVRLVGVDMPSRVVIEDHGDHQIVARDHFPLGGGGRDLDRIAGIEESGGLLAGLGHRDAEVGRPGFWPGPGWGGRSDEGGQDEGDFQDHLEAAG